MEVKELIDDLGLGDIGYTYDEYIDKGLDRLEDANFHFEMMLIRLCEIGKNDICEELLQLDRKGIISGRLKEYMEYLVQFDYDKRWRAY